MEIRHMRYFVVLAEQLNFRKAAEQLFVTQPHVSRQIKELENEVGVPLLTRNTRGVALTEAGESFLHHARKLLSDVQIAFDDMSNMARGTAGRVKFGTAIDFVGSELSEMLRQYHDLHPQVFIQTHIDTSSNLALQVVRRELDVALVFTPLPVEARFLESINILPTQLVALVSNSHRFSSRKRISLYDLRDDIFVLWSGTKATFGSHLDQLFREAGFRPKLLHETNSSTLMKDLISERGFVSIGTTATKHPPHDGYCRISLKEKSAKAIPASLVWSQDNPFLKNIDFLQIVRSVFA